MGLKWCCDNVGAFVECCAKQVLDVLPMPDEHLSEIYCINCGASIIFLLDIVWPKQAEQILIQGNRLLEVLI